MRWSTWYKYRGSVGAKRRARPSTVAMRPAPNRFRDRFRKEIGTMALLGVPDNFQSSNDTTYTLMFIDAGPWVDADGRNCELVSVNGFGDPRWEVHPATASDSDREAAAHFNLSPFRESGKIERRRSIDRRHGERRHGERRLRIRDSVERRLDERRGGERRPGNWRDSLGRGAPTNTSGTADAAVEAAPVSALLRPRRGG